MNALFVGSKDRGVTRLEALLNADHTIVRVITSDEGDPDGFCEGSFQGESDARGLRKITPTDINVSRQFPRSVAP